MRVLASPQRVIRAVLVSQVVLGLAIVGLDLWRMPGRAAPDLFAPPAQGPSTRPYRPNLRPGAPGGPAMRAMPAQLEFGQSEGAITVTGQIAPGDADRFLTWLDQTRPTETRVSLDSSGGSVSDAVAIGRVLRSSGKSAEVGATGVCLSACPYMLAGGTARRVAPGGVVGVHQHYFGQNTILPAFMAVRDLQRSQAGVLDYLSEMGVDLRIMSYALRTPPDEINILDAQLLRELRLVTSEDTADS